VAITFARPPAAANDALVRGLATFGERTPGVSLLRTTPPRGRTWTMEHSVYHLGLEAVRSHRGVDAAEPVSWRYVIGDANDARKVAADVQLRRQEHTFAGIQQGPFVQGFTDEVRRLSSDPALRAWDFEPRLLQVPAIYVVALWLHEARSKEDLFIPLPPVNRALQAGHRYNRAEFESALERAAARIHNAPPVRREPGTEAP
jgi:hypothetical protein